MVFGILAPVLTRFAGQGFASTPLPAVFVVFAAAFAFYWGGMIASYKAPSRRRLHGVLVGVSSFLISPVVNLFASAVNASGNDPVANLRTSGTVLVTGAVFVAVLVASYVGSRRGEALHAHNQAHLRARERREREKKANRPSSS